MRESINGAWLIGIIMTFMAVFIAYTAISLNYSNAFLMRTQMITIIEQYEGVNQMSLRYMHDIMDGYGYRNKGTCSEGSVGIYFTNRQTALAATDTPAGRNYAACVTRSFRYATDRWSKGGTAQVKYYYNLAVFFDFNLPIIGDIFKFNVVGETNAIYYPNDDYNYGG